MDLATFRQTLTADDAPADLSTALRALWKDANDDWHGAHDLLQSDATAEGSWVHAYLHRKEGDLSNAGYWYAKAGRPAASGSLAAEWEAIAAALLGQAR